MDPTRSSSRPLGQGQHFDEARGLTVRRRVGSLLIVIQAQARHKRAQWGLLLQRDFVALRHVLALFR
jgi:hypothetical protein